MSKKDKTIIQKSRAVGQPIYDTEYEDSASRSQQRKQNAGFTLFDDRLSFYFS